MGGAWGVSKLSGGVCRRPKGVLSLWGRYVLDANSEFLKAVFPHRSNLTYAPVKSHSKHTYVEPATPRNVVTTYVSDEGVYFHELRKKRFMTPENAQKYQLKLIREGGRWLRTDVVPTRPFKGVPDIRAWRNADKTVSVFVDGRTLVAHAASGREITRAVRAHPRFEEISCRPCRICYQKPRVDMVRETIVHKCKLKGMKIRHGHDLKMIDPIISIGLKIAMWNLHLSKRCKPLNMEVGIPHFMAKGIMRDPSQRDMLRRVRKIELL